MTFFRIPPFIPSLFRYWVWRPDPIPGAVYLTFDDGPIPEVTPWLLDILKKENIRATFFCVGENVQKNREIYQRILSEGHAVGNHTMRHERGLKTKNKDYLHSVREASKEIKSNLFRPPYGSLTWQQSRKLRKEYKIIMWNWLSYDFDRKVPIQQILAKAKTEIKSGDLVVFHDNLKSADRLKRILPEFIEIIKEKNLVALPLT